MLAGLAAITHVTTLLVTVPALAMSAMRRSSRERVEMVLGALGPLAVWGLWAAWYYGSPVPNPVIARHASQVPMTAIVGRGWAWLADAAATDPIALLAIAGGVALPLIHRSPARALSLGVLLYLAVVTLTGGDVMSGRWVGVPFVVAMVLVVREARLERTAVAVPALAVGLALAAVSPRAVLASDRAFGAAPTSAPALAPYDARAFDYAATGLLRFVRQSRLPDWPGGDRAYEAWADADRVIVAGERPGFTGYAAGYGVYVIDPTGEADPLLARWARPSDQAEGSPYDAIWSRRRQIPDGYVRSLPDKPNALTDPMLADYYDRVRFVTRGPLGSWRRPLAAMRLWMSPAPAWTR
jgi:arabinofuranosyltransferase